MNSNIFKYFLIAILIVGTLNLAYADSGPIIGANQAKTAAQNYLNSHNLPYKAVTPTMDAWQIKVKDTKTGTVKWIRFGVYKEDSPDFGGPGRYNAVKGLNDAWIVSVNDNSGKKVGVIYVDAQNGKITTTELKSTDTNQNSTSNVNITPESTNATNQVPQANNNNLWIIGAIVIVIIAAGAGYWFYRRRK